jgi:hypothetical protein
MNHYEHNLYPMIHVGDDVVLNNYGIPFVGSDHRILVNKHIADTYYQEHGNVQYHYIYTEKYLEDDLRGLDNAVNAERYRQLKELQAYKDLLSNIGYLTSTGEMTQEDLRDTQNTIHKSLKDGHNDYYQWFDLRQFPASFVQDVGLTKFKSLCTYLRKTHRVWYVCHSEDRVVMMGDNHNALIDCMDDLCDKLRVSAAGGWIDYGTDYAYGTTQRYERFNDRMDTQFANIHLIAKTWSVTVDEAFTRLTNETDQEYEQENALRLFALR